MPTKLIQLKKNYYNYLDTRARHIAFNLSKRRKVTKLLLDYISELYDSVKVEKDFTNKKFESAYHPSVTPELEFLIARILYHYSNFKNLNWKIYLRRQFRKTAPDVRIEKDGKTIAVIEIKAKVGWMQYFFNRETEKKDIKKLKEGKTDWDARKAIKITRNQLFKYVKTYGISKDQLFVFLPTLTLVHKQRSKRTLRDYEKDFEKNSRLKKENFILLSKNLTLDLDPDCKRKDYQPTDRFERFVKKLK